MLLDLICLRKHSFPWMNRCKKKTIFFCPKIQTKSRKWRIFYTSRVFSSQPNWLQTLFTVEDAGHKCHISPTTGTKNFRAHCNYPGYILAMSAISVACTSPTASAPYALYLPRSQYPRWLPYPFSPVFLPIAVNPIWPFTRPAVNTIALLSLQRHPL